MYCTFNRWLFTKLVFKLTLIPIGLDKCSNKWSDKKELQVGLLGADPTLPFYPKQQLLLIEFDLCYFLSIDFAFFKNILNQIFSWLKTTTVSKLGGLR